jgi:hypothetical protein
MKQEYPYLLWLTFFGFPRTTWMFIFVHWGRCQHALDMIGLDGRLVCKGQLAWFLKGNTRAGFIDVVGKSRRRGGVCPKRRDMTELESNTPSHWRIRNI